MFLHEKMHKLLDLLHNLFEVLFKVLDRFQLQFYVFDFNLDSLGVHFANIWKGNFHLLDDTRMEWEWAFVEIFWIDLWRVKFKIREVNFPRE